MAKRERRKTGPDWAHESRELFKGTQEDPPSKLGLPPLAPGLHVVATPIGNLGDITLRALWVLGRADALLCEDTRVTRTLLTAYDLHTPCLACHTHNEEARIPEILARLAAGESLALVSDAGTPLLSDPGARVVRACRAAGHPVHAVPGASALLAALMTLGLPPGPFLFLGFPPARPASARTRWFADLASAPSGTTLVLYESPRRLAATTQDLARVLGPDRRMAVARELTKMFEETREDHLEGWATTLAKAPDSPRGEHVLVIFPASPSAQTSESDLSPVAWEDRLAIALEAGQSVRDAVATVARESKIPRGEIYRRALALRHGTPAPSGLQRERDSS